MERIAPKNPTERLIGYINNDLRRSNIGKIDILLIAEKEDEWTECSRDRPRQGGSDDELRRWLATILINAEPDLVEDTLIEIKDICSNKEPSLTIFRRIEPRWVDENTAKVIGSIVLGRSADRSLAISVANEWALQAYVCRASGRQFGQSRIFVYGPPEREQAASTFDQDAASIEKFVERQLALDSFTDEQKKRFFKQEEKKDRPIVVSLKEEWWPPHPNLVAALRKRPSLEKVVFCFAPALDRPGDQTIREFISPTKETEDDSYMRHVRVLHELEK